MRSQETLRKRRSESTVARRGPLSEKRGTSSSVDKHRQSDAITASIQSLSKAVYRMDGRKPAYVPPVSDVVPSLAPLHDGPTHDHALQVLVQVAVSVPRERRQHATGQWVPEAGIGRHTGCCRADPCEVKREL